jgi:hypothetical protein
MPYEFQVPVRNCPRPVALEPGFLAFGFHPDSHDIIASTSFSLPEGGVFVASR